MEKGNALVAALLAWASASFASVCLIFFHSEKWSCSIWVILFLVYLLIVAVYEIFIMARCIFYHEEKKKNWFLIFAPFFLPVIILYGVVQVFTYIANNCSFDFSKWVEKLYDFSFGEKC